jgi:hypothetical protein
MIASAPARGEAELWTSLFVALDTAYDLELDTILDEYGEGLCDCDPNFRALREQCRTSLTADFIAYLGQRRTALGLAAA